MNLVANYCTKWSSYSMTGGIRRAAPAVCRYIHPEKPISARRRLHLARHAPDEPEFPILLNVRVDQALNVLAVSSSAGQRGKPEDQWMSEASSLVDTFIQLLGAERVSHTDVFFRISSSIGVNVDYANPVSCGSQLFHLVRRPRRAPNALPSSRLKRVERPSGHRRGELPEPDSSITSPNCSPVRKTHADQGTPAGLCHAKPARS
jgi:hypothetical protein